MSAQALRQLLHLSDIHFGPHHRPNVAKGLLALLRERPADLVVVSGDLTQRAKAAQFQAARAWLDRIRDDLGIPVLAVPGNHDVPAYRVLERMTTPFRAYREHFDETLEPTFEDEALFVVGVNSAHAWTQKDGRLSRAHLRRLDERLMRAPRDKARIVVIHHPLVPAQRFDNQRVLFGADEMATLLARHGVELVLSGHLHQSFTLTSDAYYPGRTPAALLVNSGTSTSRRGRGCERGRSTCNWIQIEDEQAVVSCLDWRTDVARFVEQSRLHHPRPSRAPYGLSLL